LQTYQLLLYDRTAEALADLFGIDLAEGTLAHAQAVAWDRLAPVEQAIGAALRQAAVVHVDETGQRVAGRIEWVHGVSTGLLTFYAHHLKRGREAIDASGLLVGHLGRRVHDSLAPYLQLPGGVCALQRASLAGVDWPVRRDRPGLGPATDPTAAEHESDRGHRMLKVKGKVSGGFRSAAGAAQFCRIRGYISTLRKQGISVLAGLTSVFTGQPLMPRLEA
jgi:hypothetical protein